MCTHTDTNLEEELFGADGKTLLLGSGKVFFLTDISHEGVDFIALLDEPSKDTRGIYRVRSARVAATNDRRDSRTETTRVGEENASLGLSRHCFSRLSEEEDVRRG